MSLIEKTVLVTGSAQGIGLAVAKSFAKEGCKIAAHGLADEKQASVVTEEIKLAGASQVQFFHADMREPANIDSMMDELEDWGPVDILVNNAGVQKTCSLADLTPEIWNSILSVNLSGAFHTMRRALPVMESNGYGRVINIASVHGLVASINKGPYVASKFGLVGLSKVAALEYANKGAKEAGGITVNCICPGWTESALIQPQIQARATELGTDRETATASLLAEKQPSQRTSDPGEIGQLAVWLSNPIAHNITGTSIPIDGGWTAQ